MIRGIYTSATGMLAELTRNDVAANNLANVNTAGYKKDMAVFKSFPEMLLRRIDDLSDAGGAVRPVVGNLGTGVIIDEVVTSHDQGQWVETGNPLDLAIEGRGFFVVNTPQGERYTRNGNFTMNRDGFLITSEGNFIMGEKGPIKVNGENIEINVLGEIWVDGQLQDKLRIVDFADYKQLEKIGNSLFAGTQPQAAKGFGIRQGVQEGSNVNAITEMVDLITIMRAYEANQKVLQAHDNTLGKAVELGRV